MSINILILCNIEENEKMISRVIIKSKIEMNTNFLIKGIDFDVATETKILNNCCRIFNPFHQHDHPRF